MTTIRPIAPPVKSSSQPLSVHLALIISGQSYAVEVLGPPDDADVNALVRLQKLADGTCYDVSRHADGLLRCTCPDHVYRREGHTAEPCKHGRALVAVGLIEASIPTRASTPTPRDRAASRAFGISLPEPAACCSPSDPVPCGECASAESVPADDSAWPDWTDDVAPWPVEGLDSDAEGLDSEVDSVDVESRAWWDGFRAAVNDLSARTVPSRAQFRRNV